jgi:hypothetical protein
MSETPNVHPPSTVRSPGEESRRFEEIIKLVLHTQKLVNDNLRQRQSEIARRSSASAAAVSPDRASASGRKTGLPDDSPKIPTASELESDPTLGFDLRIAKYFEGPESKPYFGTIKNAEYKSCKDEDDVESEVMCWDAFYDDGDWDSLDADEVVAALELYQETMADDTNPGKRRSE